MRLLMCMPAVTVPDKLPSVVHIENYIHNYTHIRQSDVRIQTIQNR